MSIAVFGTPKICPALAGGIASAHLTNSSWVRARHTALQDFIAGDHPEARKPAESLVRVAGIEPVNAEPSFKVT
jgi:hypothetical protein